jgi:ribonuclease E
MASPDEARADEARDQSSVPDSAPSPTTSTGTVPTSDEPSAPAPQRRPRGAASFPGGPPPASTPPADTPVVPPPAPEPVAPPQFQVTTVESAGASFPGGPPPPAPPPSDDPAPPAATARTEAPAPPNAPQPPAPPEVGGRPEPEPSAAPADEGQATRTGGRRRRRGGRGRASADTTTAADAGDLTGAAEPHAGAQAPAEPGAGRAPATQTGAGPTAGPAPAAAAADSAGPATGEDEATTTVGGSARTRARRRRRAAAKARGRQVPDGDAQVATVGEAGAEPAAPRSDRAAAAQLDAAAAPTAAPTAAPAGDQQPAPSRSSRSRRRGGGGNGDAQQVRPADGEAQAGDGDPQAAGAGTRTAGERSGRSRRRGRGGSRLAAVDADTAATSPEATADADADRAEGRDQAGGGRNRGAGSDRSTRLETRSRREGARQADRTRRRRPSGLTEEQKRILREEGPERRMVVTEGAERTQIGVLEGQTLVEHYVTRKSGRSMVGNIYLGRVQNVLPGMEAAFVDIGRGRNAVLYAGEVNYNEEDLDGEAPRIEKVLKAGQPVLVQVTKDPIGAKGARLTAQVSLAGRYLVLQPEDNTFGISRRLPETERSRLRDILKEVRPKGLGLIVRTAAEGASADDLRADLARLQARWETVERKAKKASAPAAIYSEPELVVRVIRDIFSPDFVELVVDGDDLHQRVEEYLAEVAPDLLPKLHKHQGKLPVFEHYRVVEQIHKALERKVWLPSGGSIVIDRTEAMTVIDVNTGKFVGKANLEETVVANNLEAADEIVRQLRLRDIGGIIIIDFIDMLFERNQQAVVDRLRAALMRDKTKSQVMEVSSLGLVQMTRKRVSGGLLDSFSETCPTCDGRGVVITHEIQ